VDDPQAQPGGVEPAPVQTAFAVATVPTPDGQALVVLRTQTPVGISMFFMDPASAVQLGNALRAEGKAGVSRLAVPPSGLIVPG
jgi:hypothetical protein